MAQEPVDVGTFQVPDPTDRLRVVDADDDPPAIPGKGHRSLVRAGVDLLALATRVQIAPDNSSRLLHGKPLSDGIDGNPLRQLHGRSRVQTCCRAFLAGSEVPLPDAPIGA